MSDKEPVDILLVDDQPGKLLSYRAILEELGETLLVAGSGREALERLLKRNVAVILIDVIMPELDGFTLATMIREHPRFERTAIIFVSAAALTDIDLLKGYEHGAVDYVAVPIVPELLRAKVRVFVDLYRKTRQLQTLNTELERRVNERTAALAQANHDLERRVEERTHEREIALAQVHEMQKLESLGQLTGGVAHDFNNVLMAILGNLELAATGTPSPSEILNYIARAIRAAERGSALAQRMLTFAKRQELKPEIVDITALARSAVELLRPSLGPSIEIQFDFPQNLGLICVDPNQLELAIVNLALNARDAMPLGGRLTISGARGLANGEAPPHLPAGEYVRLTVADSGDGMDERTLQRAPEPFFTTKGLGGGTGLGLSMVFGLAEQSGGAARLFSKLGQGTNVILWFPLSDRTDLTSHPGGVPKETGIHPRMILLVDDDLDVMAATASMLRRLGHHVLVAPSGLAAIDIVRKETRLDLVITDHAMPGMTGMELAERIRNVRPGLLVILATGYADLTTAIDPDMPRLHKPYRLEVLAEMLRQVLLGDDSRASVTAGSRETIPVRPSPGLSS